MAADIKLKGAARATVIDDNATLANNARAAGDYNNDTGLNLFCTAYLQVQYDAGPPAAGAEIARLYVLPGDDEGSEIFPDGGDAGLGTDDTPQQVFYVGSFESINPSTRVNWRSPQANGLTAWWPFLAQGGRRAGAGTTPNQLNLIDPENWLQPSATASEQPQVSADPLGHSVLLFDKTDGRNMSSQVGWSSLLSASAGIISLWVYLTENGAAGTNTYDLGRLVTNAGTGTVGIHYGDRAGAGQKIHA